jgi:hypothetical protein
MTFLYGPLLVLLVLNFGFFFVTLGKIYITQRQLGTILNIGKTSVDKKMNRNKYDLAKTLHCGDLY